MTVNAKHCTADALWCFGMSCVGQSIRVVNPRRLRSSRRSHPRHRNPQKLVMIMFSQLCSFVAAGLRRSASRELASNAKFEAKPITVIVSHRHVSSSSSRQTISTSYCARSPNGCTEDFEESACLPCQRTIDDREFLEGNSDFHLSTCAWRLTLCCSQRRVFVQPAMKLSVSLLHQAVMDYASFLVTVKDSVVWCCLYSEEQTCYIFTTSGHFFLFWSCYSVLQCFFSNRKIIWFAFIAHLRVKRINSLINFSLKSSVIFSLRLPGGITLVGDFNIYFDISGTVAQNIYWIFLGNSILKNPFASLLINMVTHWI